jgi:hypothetical protein
MRVPGKHEITGGGTSLVTVTCCSIFIHASLSSSSFSKQHLGLVIKYIFEPSRSILSEPLGRARLPLHLSLTLFIVFVGSEWLAVLLERARCESRVLFRRFINDKLLLLIVFSALRTAILIPIRPFPWLLSPVTTAVSLTGVRLHG